MKIGEYVKKLREERGWIQEQLAQLSGVKRGYIASLESNRIKEPPFEKVVKLAKAFRMKPEQLYGTDGYTKEEEADPRKEIVDLIAQSKGYLHQLERKLANFTEHIYYELFPSISPHNITRIPPFPALCLA